MLIPLFSEYRYMYPLEPEYEYVPKEAVLLAAIVPSFFPLESATIKSVSYTHLDVYKRQ